MKNETLDFNSSLSRQDSDFVGVQLVLVFVWEVVNVNSVNQFGDERSRASRRVENVYAFVRQTFTEMLFQQPIGRINHKPDDFIRRVNDSELVRAFRVINFVEVFINGFEKFLFFVIIRNARSRVADSFVIIFDGRQIVFPK